MVCGMVRSHDNSKFASSGGDRSIFLWDVTAGATTRRLPGHMGKINVVEFNEDSTVLASGEYTYFNFCVGAGSNARLEDLTTRLSDSGIFGSSLPICRLQFTFFYEQSLAAPSHVNLSKS